MSVLKVTSENFESEVLQSDRPVLVDFNATWCGPCRMMGPVLEELSEEQSKVKIVAVDVDDEGELAGEYGVYSIPCLVLIKDGKEVKRSVGFGGKDGVLALLSNV